MTDPHQTGSQGCGPQVSVGSYRPVVPTLLLKQKLKKGAVTLTIRTCGCGPSPAPPLPSLATGSSLSTSDSSGNTGVSGMTRGPGPAPKHSLAMEVVLDQGQLLEAYWRRFVTPL